MKTKIFADSFTVAGLGLSVATVVSIGLVDGYMNFGKTYQNRPQEIDTETPLAPSILAYFSKTGKKDAVKAFRAIKGDNKKLRWVYRYESDAIVALYQAYNKVAKETCRGGLETCGASLQAKVAKLYEMYEPSEAFVAWEDTYASVFLACTAGDTQLIDIRKRWRKLNGEDRIAIAQRISNWYAHAFRQSGLVITSPDVVLGKRMGEVLGRYTKFSQFSRIEVSEETVSSKDFNTFAAIVIHEARHNLEYALSDAIASDNSRNLIASAVLPQAEIFRLTLPDEGYLGIYKKYVSYDRIWYWQNPTETHARAGEASAKLVGVAQGNAPKCPAMP